MGLVDKLLAAGGVVLIGARAWSAYTDAQETNRRRNSPLTFDDGVTHAEFIELARDIAKSAPRVEDVVVTGMSATLHVRSSSGLTTWTADIDFNDYGHLTGAYWMKSENTDSLIPAHFANTMRQQIEKRVSRTNTPR